MPYHAAMRWVVVAVVAITLGGSARAHVAPSVDDNNRYLKVTPQADRVRLAYTVFFGEVPGAALRPQLDTNQDGSVDEREAQTYGNRVAADVLAAFEVAVDGKQQRLAWKQIVVGLGTSSTRGGSFSVDMIAYVCTEVGGRHQVHVRDRFRVPKPGETEVRVEDGLGIKVERAKIADASALNNDFKFVGPGGPLADTGLDVVYVADDKAPVSGECGPPPRQRHVPWVWIAAGAIIAVTFIGLFVNNLRRR